MKEGRVFIILEVIILIAAGSLYAQVPDVSWGVQFGTAMADFPRELESDALGNVYVVGETAGAMEGENAGGKDGFLSKFNASGTSQWTRQFGTSGTEIVTGVAVDRDANVLITGQTTKALGAESFGSTDVFAARIDAQGNTLWLVQKGTEKADLVTRMAVDARGNCIITGKTTGVMGDANAGGYDVFVLKLDGQGNTIWTKQFGTDKNDEGTDIAISSEGDLFLSGITTGGFDIQTLGGEDAFAARLDSSGTVIWVRQFGTNQQDQGKGIALDTNGNVYVGGWTGGDMESGPFGSGDAYLTYFDQDGNRQWTRQFGTANWDGAHGLTAFQDESGDALVGGCWTWPSCHGWMRRYNNQGNLIWEKLIYQNALKASCGQTVFTDQQGNCYHIGGTDDNLYSESLGTQDVFLVKLSVETGIRDTEQLPRDFNLEQNTPNPFNPDTEIRYTLRSSASVRLVITDVSGKEIIALTQGPKVPGTHGVRWNATDRSGQAVSSGVYICKLFTNRGIDQKKMLLIR